MIPVNWGRQRCLRCTDGLRQSRFFIVRKPFEVSVVVDRQLIEKLLIRLNLPSAGRPKPATLMAGETANRLLLGIRIERILLGLTTNLVAWADKASSTRT